MLNPFFNSFPDSADASGEKTIEFYVTLEEIWEVIRISYLDGDIKKNWHKTSWLSQSAGCLRKEGSFEAPSS